MNTRLFALILRNLFEYLYNCICVSIIFVVFIAFSFKYFLKINSFRTIFYLNNKLSQIMLNLYWQFIQNRIILLNIFLTLQQFSFKFQHKIDYILHVLILFFILHYYCFSWYLIVYHYV